MFGFLFVFPIPDLRFVEPTPRRDGIGKGNPLSAKMFHTFSIGRRYLLFSLKLSVNIFSMSHSQDNDVFLVNIKYSTIITNSESIHAECGVDQRRGMF